MQDAQQHGDNSETSNDTDEVVCHACGFESSYVPEGMMPCERCEAVHYCSLHCLQWDWKSGGHADTCIDVRPEQQDSSSNSNGADSLGAHDDATVQSMGVSDVFRSSEHTTGTSDLLSTPPATASTTESTPSSSVVKERQELWEKKTKATAVNSNRSGGNKLSSFFASQKSNNSPKKQTLLQQQMIHPKPMPVVGHNPYAGYGNDDSNSNNHYDDDDDDSLDMVSATNTEASDLKSIREEESVSEEPEEQGSWRARDPFEVSEHTAGEHNKKNQQDESASQVTDNEEEEEVFEEEVYDEEEYDEEEYHDADQHHQDYDNEESSIQITQDSVSSQESQASGKEQKGMFAESGAEKLLALSPERLSVSVSSRENSPSVKRMKKVLLENNNSNSANNSIAASSSTSSRVVTPERAAASQERDSSPSRPPVTRTKSGDSSQDFRSNKSTSSAISLKEFRESYGGNEKRRNSTAAGEGGAKDTKSLKLFRDVYTSGNDSFSTSTVIRVPCPSDEHKKQRRASMQEVSGHEPAPRQRMRRRMSLEDKLERISVSTADEEMSASLKSAINKALREYEATYGPAATKEAMAELTEEVKKKHDKEQASKRHQYVTESSWGPATISGGMSDSISNVDSFANASLSASISNSTYQLSHSNQSGSAMASVQESSLLEERHSSAASVGSEEDDLLPMPGRAVVASTGSGSVMLGSHAAEAPGATPMYHSSNKGSSGRVSKDHTMVKAAIGGAAVSAVVAAGAQGGTNGATGNMAPSPAGGTAASGAASNTATASAPNGSMPRYMQYRSSLSRPTDVGGGNGPPGGSALPVAGQAADSSDASTSSEEDAQDDSSSNVPEGAALGAVAAGAAISSSGGSARFMRYRSPSARPIEAGDESGPQAAMATVVDEESSDSSYHSSDSSVSSEETEQDESSSNVLVGATAGAAVAGAVVASAVVSSASSDRPAASSATGAAANSSMPRYMQYRSSLARSTDAADGNTPMAPRTLNMSEQSPDNNDASVTSEGTEEDGSNRHALLGAAAGGAVVAGAVVAGTASRSNEATASPATGAATNSSMPRYMKYRSSLVRPADGKAAGANAPAADDHSSASSASSASSQDDESNSNALVGAVAGATVVGGVAAAGASSSTPRYMQYRSSLALSTGGDATGASATDGHSSDSSDSSSAASEEDESNANALVGAVAGAAIVGGAVTAGVLASGAGSNEPKEVPAAGNPEPRYMQYRSSLARSTEGGPPDVLAADEQSSVSSDASSHAEEESNSNALAGVAAGAVVAGAVTAGVLASDSSAGQASADSSMPRYMQYRSSLARSTEGGPPDVLAADEQSSDSSDASFASSDQDTENDHTARNALLGVAAGAAVAGAVTAGVLASGEDSGKAAGQSGAPASQGRTIHGDEEASEMAMPPEPVRDELSFEKEDESRSGSGAALAGVGVAAAGAIASGGGPESEDETMQRFLSYQASIAQTMETNGKQSEADEAKRLAEAASEGKTLTGNSTAGEMTMSPRAAQEDASFSSCDDDVDEDPNANDGDRDIEAGLAGGRPKYASESGGSFFTRRRLECFAILLLLLGIGLGVGLGVRNGSSREVGASDAPTVSPTVLSTLIPTRAPAGPVTESPTQLQPLLTESPSQVPSTAPTNGPTVSSSPSVVPASNGPTVSSSPSIVPTTSVPTSVPTIRTTTAPSLAPTLVDQELFELLRGVSFDNGTSIQTPGTPQNLAYEWLANSTNLGLLSEERQIQRYALATFFYGTGGETWNSNVGWLSGIDECSWFSRSSLPTCNALGQYVDLNLGFNGVSGNIPPETALLSELTRVELSGGAGLSITGSLPSELGLLTSLMSFRVRRNAMTGAIPPLGALSALDTLDLSENRFTGALPSEMGLLTALIELDLTTNNLTGQLPTDLGLLVALEQLSLGENIFTGAVPQQLGLLTQLRVLGLETNALTSIPAEFGSLTLLRSLTVYENGITGTLHSELGSLSELRKLDLRSNQFTGAIPSFYGSLVNLQDLDLSSNALSGAIPPQIGELVQLFSLRLQSNRLSGEMPVAFGLLQRLSEIRIDDNDLVGAVPNAVCDVFSSTLPTFYLDCGGQPPELVCPPGTCCTYCCEDGVGCECVYAGTGFDFLC